MHIIDGEQLRQFEIFRGALPNSADEKNKNKKHLQNMAMSLDHEIQACTYPQKHVALHIHPTN
jgi:hypothetical protein